MSCVVFSVQWCIIHLPQSSHFAFTFTQIIDRSDHSRSQKANSSALFSLLIYCVMLYVLVCVSVCCSSTCRFSVFTHIRFIKFEWIELRRRLKGCIQKKNLMTTTTRNTFFVWPGRKPQFYAILLLNRNSKNSMPLLRLIINQPCPFLVQQVRIVRIYFSVCPRLPAN